MLELSLSATELPLATNSNGGYVIIKNASIVVLVSIATGNAFAQQQTGFVFLDAGGSRVNHAAITRVQYTGQCPGESIVMEEGYFQSSTTRPLSGLRVKIENVTGGFSGDRIPYTERKYNKGSVSEGAFLGFSAKHRGKFLAVREGQNELSYSIMERDGRIVEKGQFVTQVSFVDGESYDRPKQCRWETSCNEFACFPVEICACPSE